MDEREQAFWAWARAVTPSGNAVADIVARSAWDAAWDCQQERVERLQAALNAYEDIVTNSQGVAGWHLNGDVATWDEFDLPTAPQEETHDG